MLDEGDTDSTGIEISVVCNSDEERDDPEFDEANTDPLASLRYYLTEKIGADTLGKASQVLRTIDERDLVASGYEKFYANLDHLMSTALSREYFPLIHTLIFIESKI
jgi:hypothetical protein